LILSKTSFSQLKNLQHLEEISSTPSTHLERLLLSLQRANKKPCFKRILLFYVVQANTFKNLKTKFPKTFTRNLKNFSYTSNFNVETFNNSKNALSHTFLNFNVENLKKLEELSFTLLNLKLET